MSLFGALSLGGASLSAQQAALQVTGNNIANSGTAGYTRETADLQSAVNSPIGSGLSTGSGVTLASVQRQVSEALNENVRDATSDQSASQSLTTTLTSLQNAFGALSNNSLSSQLTSFFNDFQNLSVTPTDSTQQSQVILDGQTLATSIQTLQSQVVGISQSTNQQIGTLSSQVNGLTQDIASLNQQIGSQPASGTNSLQDQRDQDLSQLSQLVNITVVPQSNGEMNVLVGNATLIQGSSARSISTTQTTDASGNNITSLTFADNGDSLNATGGQIGGLISAQQNYVSAALTAVNSIASGLINAVNSIYSQGQGTTGYSNITSATALTSNTAALNAGQSTTGLTIPPTSGTFDIYVTDASGNVTTEQINVNLDGTTPPQTSLDSLASDITSGSGGALTASANANGTLSIAASGNNTFTFGNDSSGVLAALGINTFFSGTDASNIAVNSTLANNSGYLATGRINAVGDSGTGPSANATALASAGTAALASLGGNSVMDTYTNYVGSLAVQAQAANNNLTSQTTIQSTLTAQQQSISGVSLDEETINMMQYQRAFEGSARFITTVDELMQTVLGLIQ